MAAPQAVRFPAPGVTAPASPGSRPTLDRLLDRAAVRAERGVAYTRLGLAFFALVRLVSFGGLAAVAKGQPGYILAASAMVFGCGFSAWILWALRPGSHRQFVHVVAVTVDALLILAALGSFVVWRPPGYLGLLRTPDTSAIVVATVAAGLRLSRRVAIVGVLEMAAVSGSLLVADYLLNGGRSLYGPYEVSIGFIVLLGAGVLAFAMAVGTRRLVYEGADAEVTAERARQRLGVYVSEEVANEALAVEALTTGGRRQNVAVLFSDLRGFTPYAESMDPERLVAELNAYLDAMVQAIRAEGGMVDKFIGDSIMVVFGVPDPGGDDAARAIRTAVAMNRALEAHNAARAARGRPGFRQGIGVHYGPVVAGNIGNAERLQYTVIGDVVNLASRLQSATKREGTSILVSATAVEAARAAGEALDALEGLGPVRVAGREAPVEVFSLRSS